jgi:hypothetical protein
MHPTLVVRKNSNTASAALTSHSSLTEGVRECFHSHASPISFYNPLHYGAHARAQDRSLNPLPLCHEKGCDAGHEDYLDAILQGSHALDSAEGIVCSTEYTFSPQV